MADLSIYKDQVKAAVDLRDVFAMHGVELRKVNGSTSKCCCPHHNEKTPSCHVHPEYYHCFGCKVSGDVFSWLQHTEHMTFIEALRRAGEIANIPMPDMDPERAAAYQQRQQDLKTTRELLDACQLFYRECLEQLPVGEAARVYCESRGWSADIRESFGIGFAPNDWQLLHRLTKNGANTEHVKLVMVKAGILAEGENSQYLRFKNRIMFPVSDARGRICGYSGRLLPTGAPGDNKKAKFINTATTDLFDKSSLLFGLPQAAKSIADKGIAVVVEGQGDVIACHQSGHTTAVAPMGTALTVQHLDQLKRLTPKVVMMFDGDSAGVNATMKSIDTFLEHRAKG